jgi:hypothetical protein
MGKLRLSYVRVDEVSVSVVSFSSLFFPMHTP